MSDISSDIAVGFATNVLTELFKQSLSGLETSLKWLQGKDVFGGFASKYLDHLSRRHGAMRILGMDRPVPLRSIYVRVNLLERVSSRAITSIKDLEERFDYENRTLQQTSVSLGGDQLVSTPKYGLSQQSLERVLTKRAIPKLVLDKLKNFSFETFDSEAGLALAIRTRLTKEEADRYTKDIVAFREVVPHRYIVLGKPGAGKTTFLKYLMFEALDEHQIHRRIPIFINLKDLSDSTKGLIQFIIEQFDVCELADARVFVFQLLRSGKCIILLDGLDEVKKEKEHGIIGEIDSLVLKYPLNQYIISCRVAAYHQDFPTFSNVEIADFDDEQIRAFVTNWFSSAPKIGALCWRRLNETREIRELAKTPLLLTLLCIAFEDSLKFPPNRADLYREGIDALLRKWDSSRRINRGEIYKHLSSPRKEMMLSEIAADAFERAEYFMPQRTVEALIQDFISNLPEAREDTLAPDSEAILKAVESQHGLLVERARGIYSFSHLTFQEYFTAKHVVDNVHKGSLVELVNTHLMDDRWREVILLTAGMLPRADDLIELILAKLTDLGRNEVVKDVMTLSRQLARQPSPYPAALTVCLCLIYILYATPSRQRDSLVSRAMSIGRGMGRIVGESYLADTLGPGGGFGVGKKFFRAVKHKDFRPPQDIRKLEYGVAEAQELPDYSSLEKYLSVASVLLDSLNAEAYVSRSLRDRALNSIFGIAASAPRGPSRSGSGLGEVPQSSKPALTRRR